MKKKSTSVYLSDSLEDFLKGNPLGRSEIVKVSVELFSELDWKRLKEAAHKEGLTPGRLVDIAVKAFTELPGPAKKKIISDHFAELSEQSE